MKIYDLKNSHIVGGQDTSGYYEYVNNTMYDSSMYIKTPIAYFKKNHANHRKMKSPSLLRYD